uniref:Uncharacterized protein n=1 Tax=Anopheles atroparvus TaxID=41427 RepID=A0AAG5DF60_ANOAO
MLCFLTIIIMASKSEPFRQVVHKMEQTQAPCRDRAAVRWTKPAESEMNNFALFSRAAVRDSDDDDRCRRLIIEVNDKIHRFSVAYAKLNACNMLLFNLVPPACNFPRYLLHRNVSNRTTVEFLLPLEQDFYGLDIRRNVAHYTVFCACIIPACCLTTLILWTKGILFILIRYNTLLYQLVNRRLEEYHRRPSDGPVAMASLQTRANTRKLAEIVELHYSCSIASTTASDPADPVRRLPADAVPHDVLHLAQSQHERSTSAHSGDFSTAGDRRCTQFIAFPTFLSPERNHRSHGLQLPLVQRTRRSANLFPGPHPAVAAQGYNYGRLVLQRQHCNVRTG